MAECDDLESKAKLVDGVVQGKLKQVVQKFLDKGVATKAKDEPEERRKVRRLLAHTQHCWKLLLQKQTSLQVGLNVFQTEIWPELWSRIEKERTANPEHARELLQHLFLILLRFRDGLILVTSGECRHDGDLLAAKSYGNHCKSRLNQNTVTFRADLTYSGASWDEWNDDVVGISARWRDFFKNPKVFDKILNKVSAIEELILIPIETTMRQVQNDLHTFVNNHIIPKLKTRFGVKLSLKDKTEFLRVEDSLGSFERRRQGKQFKLPDKQGVLPLPTEEGQSLHQLWRRVIAVPSKDNSKAKKEIGTHQRKKRRIAIDDDDEDSKCIKAPVKDKASKKQRRSREESAPADNNFGLVVNDTIESASTDCRPSKNESSLNKIKESVGVDVEALTSGREALENEEATALQDGIDEITDTDRQEQAGIRVKKLRRELKLIQREQQNADCGDTSEISADLMRETFYAQESLREALVSAGRVYLNSSDEQNFPGSFMTENPNRIRDLQKAFNYFDEALAILRAQTKLHRILHNQKILSPDESRYSSRNLLLLHGRAVTNRGITQFKLFQQKGKKSCLRDCIDDFEDACFKVQSLLACVKDDHVKDGLDALDQQVQGLALQAMAARWMAVALWYRKQYSECLSKFEEVSALSNHYVDQDLFHAEVELRIQCYDGFFTAYDLAHTKLETYSAASLQEEKELRNASWFFQMAKDMLAKAQKASGTIDSLLRKSELSDEVHSSMEEQGVLSSQELQSRIEDLEKWWDRRKVASKQAIHTANHALPTSVQPSLSRRNEPIERHVFTMTQNSTRQKRQNLQSNGHSTNVRLRAYKMDDDKSSQRIESSSQSMQSSSTRYKKWGDELLPQRKDPASGKMVPVLKYPCVPPEMPPDIARIAAR